MISRCLFAAQQRALFTRTCVRMELQSPALEAAKRLVNPNTETPASGPLNEMAADDPRVQWREYWSVSDEMPYYHNLKTQEVTWDVPEGFITRFPTFHARNENIRIDADGRVQFPTKQATGTPLEPGAATTSAMTMKQKLALYGSGGFLLYLIIHNVCLTCVFVSIYFLEVDLVGLAQSYGFNIRRSEGTNDEGDTTGKRKTSFFGTFLTAVLLNKLTVPMQVATTLVLAPRFVPLLTPLANRMVPAVRAWIPFLQHKSKANVRATGTKM
jgi:hypothetical protein